MYEENFIDYLNKKCVHNNLDLLSENNKKYKDIEYIDNVYSKKMKPIKISADKKNERVRELMKKQRHDVPFNKKFRYEDILRIIKYTNLSIFDSELCCIWSGYITNKDEPKKGTYINFYFKNKKKVALHRLLYINFKGELNDNDYIKYSCENKGKCCNINHMIRFEYKLDKQENKLKKEKSTIGFKPDNKFKISFF